MADSKILLETGTNELEVLEFLIYDKDKTAHRYGINVAKVREVIMLPEYDEVPKSHSSILGVFHLRGNVIPLIDISKHLGKDGKDTGKPKVIVTEFNKQNLGFLVHEIVQIHRLSWQQVLPPTQIMSSPDQNCTVAMIKVGEHTLFMLDFEKIVTDIYPDSGMDLTGVNSELATPLTGNWRALVADDSPTIRNMVSELLTKAGFSIQSASNGEIAAKEIQLALKAGNPFDVVVSDIEMPSMDGHALCKFVKDDDELKDTPVILFSSLIYDELRKKGEAVGADAQISKPEMKDLVHVAKSLIMKRTESKAS